MVRQLLVLLVVVVAASADCLQQMCQVESNCKNVPCKWDDDAVSCGFYQLKLVYYKDCGMPEKKSGESDEAAWKRCSLSKSCSETCIRNYVNRYKSKCPGRSQCETMARLHNGGPSGCTDAYRGKTDGYWQRVQAAG